MRKTNLRHNLEILKTNKIKQSEAYKALNEICKETPGEIYAELCALEDIYDIFSIKSVVQNCIKEDKRFLTTVSKSTFVFLSTLLSISIGAVSGYIASNVKTLGELWRSLINVNKIIGSIGTIMLFMFWFYKLYKYIYSTHNFNEYRLVLILDYAIENKKEEEKNKVKVSGINRSRFSEERLYIEIIEKRDRGVRRQIKGGRKLRSTSKKY